MKHLGSLVCYCAGDAVSRVRLDWEWLGTLYQTLMRWSMDLDTDGTVWEESEP